MNASHLRSALAAGVVACCLAACAAPRSWRELGERPVPFETLWNAMVETSGRHGFPPDERATDRGRGVFQSRWREWAQGFGQSERMRVRAEMQSGEVVDDRLSWQLRFCVERQTVPDMARSMDPRESDWKPDGQHRDLEDIIEAQLRMRLGDDVVSRGRAGER